MYICVTTIVIYIIRIGVVIAPKTDPMVGINVNNEIGIRENASTNAFILLTNTKAILSFMALIIVFGPITIEGTIKINNKSKIQDTNNIKTFLYNIWINIKEIQNYS